MMYINKLTDSIIIVIVYIYINDRNSIRTINEKLQLMTAQSKLSLFGTAKYNQILNYNLSSKNEKKFKC